MKKNALILLLFVQLSGLFHKTLTIVHFFLHREEIIEHFCHHATNEEEENCQGICYLKAELSKEDNSPVKNFPINSLVQDDVVYYEIFKDFKLGYTNLLCKTTNQYSFKSPILKDFHLSLWRPPATV